MHVTDRIIHMASSKQVTTQPLDATSGCSFAAELTISEAELADELTISEAELAPLLTRSR